MKQSFRYYFTHGVAYLLVPLILILVDFAITVYAARVAYFKLQPFTADSPMTFMIIGAIFLGGAAFTNLVITLLQQLYFRPMIARLVRGPSEPWEHA